MNITKSTQLFTYTPQDSVALSDLPNIGNVSKIISINSNNVFLQYTPGSPSFLQGFLNLDAGVGYCIISNDGVVPYELYESTDDTPDSVTLNQLYQIGTYCDTSFDLFNPPAP